MGYLLLYLGNDIIEYNLIVKDLEHEKELRKSISMLTHELKNPICVCMGYLEMFNLDDGCKSKKYLSIIKNEIMRSKSIIDDFSNYGKLKSVVLDEVDLKILFDDIRCTMLPLFRKIGGCLIICDVNDIKIRGDYVKLKEVFINLLKNSLEARRNDNKLIVSIKIRKYINNIIINLSDNGIGVPSSIISKVTDMFYTTKEFGTGIGLAFCKEVIEMHNGHFKICSNCDMGCTIKIILPK